MHKVHYHFAKYILKNQKEQFMSYFQNDIADTVNQFSVKHCPNDRYASFDYCYGYFKSSSSEQLLEDMEKSCLVLGFHLASWGMMRGSSFLLGHSIKYFEPLIEYVAEQDKSIWDIDVNNYNEQNIDTILEIYTNCKDILIHGNNAHLTLITKILLGIFGFVPAFDRYFKDAFSSISSNKCGYSVCNQNALRHIHQFYLDNKYEVDSLADELVILNFITGEPSGLRYPKAKVIDMYGFTKGLNLSLAIKAS